MTGAFRLISNVGFAFLGSTSSTHKHHHKPSEFVRVIRTRPPVTTLSQRSHSHSTSFSPLLHSTSSSVADSTTMTIAPPTEDEPVNTVQVSFSHIQLYVDELETLEAYKLWEEELNELEQSLESKTLASNSDQQSIIDADYCSQNRDLVRQLLTCGWRVTGWHNSSDNEVTTTALVTSKDPKGVQFVVTTTATDDDSSTADAFSAAASRKFYQANADRPGIGVLAFSSPDVDRIRKNYESQHPALIARSYQTNDGTDILEVYAYYSNAIASGESKKADPGTILRFVQHPSSSSGENNLPLPGLTAVPASFPATTQAAYCDHWVSNVFDRNEFLDTLHDTLGFTPKVDFNAGVVAAGEAQIESTVTGNEPLLVAAGAEVQDPTSTRSALATAFSDQSQVYLPINNALSEVGHVHGFLEELGQGVQHIASRVNDLVSFVQHANDMRKMTGEGFSFLRIPRSYYGILRAEDLENGDNGDKVSAGCASSLVELLKERELLSPDMALDLDATSESLDSIIRDGGLSAEYVAEYESCREHVLATILKSRYVNLYKLLRDQVSEETYLGIVRNQILVDIQGEDLLYQIFTSNILQRTAGDEAPFLEFIQRVCGASGGGADDGKAAIRPGCGGFGIRNFLTLFLSIELSKALTESETARQAGDERTAQYARNRVDCFTEQLQEANPILTAISDAMTEEGRCKLEWQATISDDEAAASVWNDKMLQASAKKLEGNERLMACSLKYSNRMRELKEAYAAANSS